MKRLDYLYQLCNFFFFVLLQDNCNINSQIKSNQKTIMQNTVALFKYIAQPVKILLRDLGHFAVNLLQFTLVFILVQQELVLTTGSFETITKTRVNCLAASKFSKSLLGLYSTRPFNYKMPDLFW